jgi:hypothetical protein
MQAPCDHAAVKAMLEKKGTFKAGASELTQALSEAPSPGALAPLFPLVSRVYQLLKTRHTSIDFWRTGRALFTLAQVRAHATLPAWGRGCMHVLPRPPPLTCNAACLTCFPSPCMHTTAQHLPFSQEELAKLKGYSAEADAFLSEDEGVREAAAGGPSAAAAAAGAAAMAREAAGEARGEGERPGGWEGC